MLTFVGTGLLNLPGDTRDESLEHRSGVGRDLVNHSIYSADRATHLKIVVVALTAGIVVAGLGIYARSEDNSYAQTARAVKAGKPLTITSSDTSMMR